MADFNTALERTLKYEPESYESMYKRMLQHRIIDKESGCWLWVNHLSENGYGIILQRGTSNRKRKRLKRIRCHVISLTVNKGIKPKGAEACHSVNCKNKNCFNPEHLRWGTRSDNIIDTHITGKTKVSKLTHENVREVRALLDDGIKGSKIARCYGVTDSAISAIKAGKTWRFLDG